jgi:hypothetical protein
VSEYERQAAAEDAVRQIWIDWLRQRVENIHANVSAHDVLAKFGVNLSGADEEQFPCPFHGIDKRPSARVYPSSPRGPSHAWCFVCQERWDVLSLWKKFGDPNAKFTQVLREIESAFHLERPPRPDGTSFQAPDPAIEAAKLAQAEFERLLGVTDRRLRTARGAFQQLRDLAGFLTLGQVTDQLVSQVERGKIEPATATATLHRVLDKIAEKMRLAPEG